jgi:hypothetical protein
VLVVSATAIGLAAVVSPHGWDNLSMQVVPSIRVWAWLT